MIVGCSLGYSASLSIMLNIVSLPRGYKNRLNLQQNMRTEGAQSAPFKGSRHFKMKQIARGAVGDKITFWKAY